MARPNIQTAIKNVAKAMDAGVFIQVIVMALIEQGYSDPQIKSMIRWARKMRQNMATYHLYRWSMIDFYEPDPYRAPELERKCLTGFRDKDSKRVRTSPITAVNGREITTVNSIYILEDISPEYLQWMHDNGFTYDPDNPIPFKKNK